MDVADAISRLVSVLNDSCTSRTEKIAALSNLADYALTAPEVVLDHFHAVDDAFESLLYLENEILQAAEEHLDPLATLSGVLLVLVRATRYGLRTAHLLELVRGDLPLALSLLHPLFSANDVEAEATECAARLLHGFARPDTYVELEAAASGSASFDIEGSVEAFGTRLDEFSEALARSRLLPVAVDSGEVSSVKVRTLNLWWPLDVRLIICNCKPQDTSKPPAGSWRLTERVWNTVSWPPEAS